MLFTVAINIPQYGKKIQLTKFGTSNPMKDKQTKLLQQVCRKFLYYARAVNCTMLHALNNLETKALGGTQEPEKVLTHFLNCCAGS